MLRLGLALVLGCLSCGPKSVDVARASGVPTASLADVAASAVSLGADLRSFVYEPAMPLPPSCREVDPAVAASDAALGERYIHRYRCLNGDIVVGAGAALPTGHDEAESAALLWRREMGMAANAMPANGLTRWRDAGGKLHVEWTTSAEQGWDVRHFIAFVDGALTIRFHTTEPPNRDLLEDLRGPFIERARIAGTHAANVIAAARLPETRPYHPGPLPEGCADNDVEVPPSGFLGDWVCRHGDVVAVRATDTRVARYVVDDDAWARWLWREMGSGDRANSGFRFWRDDCGRRRARWVGGAAAAESDPSSFVLNVAELGSELLAIDIRLDRLVPRDREWYAAIERAFVGTPLATCGEHFRTSDAGPRHIRGRSPP